MQKIIFSRIWLSIMLGALMTMLCVLPSDPNDPKNTSVEALMESSGGVQNNFSIEDSVGKELKIGAVCFLPANLTSLTINVTTQDKYLLLDSIIDSFSTDSTYDTILIPVTFIKPGVINVEIEAVTSFGKVLRKEGTIIILGRELEINHAPIISTSGKLSLQPSDICTLTIKMNDVDSGQRLQLQTTGKPDGSTIPGDTLFIWSVPQGFSGSDTVIFIVTDNGNPVMSDSDTVVLNVSVASVNKPPKWRHPVLSFVVEAGALLVLPLADSCFDPDGDLVMFRLLPGIPAGDTLIGTSYRYQPTAGSSGNFTARIATSDNKGGGDTLTISLSIKAKILDMDTMPPRIKRAIPLLDSTTISSSSTTVSAMVTDASGIDSVTCSMGNNIFTVTRIDSIFSAIVTGLSTGFCNSIKIIATDASSMKNRDTIIFCIKYDPTIGDNVVPIFKSAGGSASGTTVTTTAFTIAYEIKDDSGIDSVWWSLNGTTKGIVAAGAGDVYTFIGVLSSTYHTNRIVFEANDKSSRHNHGSIEVVLLYNTSPSEVKLTTPANNGTGIATQTVFLGIMRILKLTMSLKKCLMLLNCLICSGMYPNGLTTGLRPILPKHKRIQPDHPAA